MEMIIIICGAWVLYRITTKEEPTELNNFNYGDYHDAK